MNGSAMDDDRSDEMEQSDADDSDSSSSSSASSTTSNSSSASTTTASSDSTTSDDTAGASNGNDALELAQFDKTLLRLPRGLCENAAIFSEFFSLETWHLLPELMRVDLQKRFLPSFISPLASHEEAENADDEQQQTLMMLFTGMLDRFGHTPLGDLQRGLEEGNYRPDVLKLRRSIAKSRRRECRFQHCEQLSQLSKELFLSRERLLHEVYQSAPDTGVSHAQTQLQRAQRRQRSSLLLYADTTLSAVRARKRFRAELMDMMQSLDIRPDELSALEEDDTEPTTSTDWRDGAILLNGEEFKCLPSSSDKYVFGSHFKRRHELSDEDAIRRDHYAKQPRLSNRNFRRYLLDHKRRKLSEPMLPDFETSDIRLRDVCARAQLGGNFKRLFVAVKGRKPRVKVATKPQSEPPALVPIAPHHSAAHMIKQTEEARPSELAGQRSQPAPQLKQYEQEQPRSMLPLSVQEHSLISRDEQAAAFDHHIHGIDGEVELQQEEVETFEETIPAFVISSNEIILPQVEIGLEIGSNHNYHTSELPENVFQTPEKERKRREEQAKRHQGTILLDKLPKLEPLSTIREKLTKPPSTSVAPVPTTPPSKHGKISHTAASTAYTITASNNVSTTAELIQETHACFFSLIRDFFCATPHHRMRYDELRTKIDVWLRNPITALNDWYTLTASWSALLHSAIDFLAGDCAANEQPNEYVPYIEHKTQLGIYQWIGAGRDSDNRLSALCLHWLQQRRAMRVDASGEMSSAIPAKLHHDDMSAILAPLATLTSASPLLRRRSTATDCGDDIESIAAAVSGSAPPQPPPLPARSPTTWTVRAATSPEVAEFQRQERERFEQPHRAYTYHMHGYESVVGPVKGIYSRLPALTKARGHSMMVGDRPNFITILTLVRDATARLPNGEGTRADISELLKCSQYISPDAAENVLQTIVSGALDRMHTENDPCVRYDPKRKIWIYLHRSRSKEEFERMHQQQQGVGGKNRKTSATGRKQKMSKTALTAGLKGSATPVDVQLTDISSSGTSATVTASNFPLPALVPANPIIVSSIQHSPQQQPKQPVLAKYPPVPPLKYNIPPSTHSQQQQKSLLKTTINTQRQQHQQSDGKAIGAIVATSNNNLSNKHFSFTMPQVAKGFVAANTTGAAAASTPLLVASTPGLQPVHGPVSGVSTLSSATLISGKKVTLSKPIIINQIAGAAVQQTFQGGTTVQKTKVQSQQLHQTMPKQQQQQLQTQRSFIIPISGNSTGSDPQHLMIDANQQQHLVSKSGNESGVLTSSQQPKQVTCIGAAGTTTKNIIRLVPAATVSNAAGVVKQPVQLIGQRVITKQQQQPQQQKTLGAGGISIISGGQIGQGGGNSGTIVKMSPQAFASLQQAQQKQGQHILFKQQQQSPPQKPRLIVGNTAIIASPTASSANKGIVLQQMGSQSANTSKSTAVSVGLASTVASSVAAPTTSKIQTINASNLTAQQQRVLLQNLRLQQHQQQQHVQFKTVQVVANAHSKQQIDPAKNQTVMLNAPQRVVVSGAPIHTAQQQQQLTGKTVAVVVSQSQQSLTRLLKTTPVATSSAQHQATQSIPANTGSSQTITTNAPTAGKIISLESLLQRQGGALRISGVQKSISTATGVSHAASTSVNNPIIQLSSSVAGGTGGTSGAQQYTVVAQPRNIITLSGGATTSVQRVQTSTSFNFAQLQGKQVVFTTKPTAGTAGVKTIATGSASQTQQMQQTGVIIGGQTVKLQGNPNMQQLVSVSKASDGGGQPATSQLQTLIMGNQILRVQQMQSQHMVKSVTNRIAMSPVTTIASNASTSGTMVVNSSDATSLNSVVNSGLPRTLVLGSTGGQSIRLQPSGAQAQMVMPKNVVMATSQQNLTAKGAVVGAAAANRVVLAVQGGGQVFLSPGFQGGTLNLKSLQNLKVVSLSPTATSSALKEATQQGDKISASGKTAQKITHQPILKSSDGGANNGGG